MKKIHTLLKLIIFYSLFSSANTFGQGVAVNTDGSSANTNAMLDVKSTNKGILIPRIDYNNRPVTSVPSGMLIYVTANGPLGNNAYYYYNGTKWLREKTSDDAQSLLLNLDTLRITESNYVVVGNILNLIGYYKCNAVYTQVATDHNNCGSCGNVCATGANASGTTCVSGICGLICNAGFANCNNLSGDGCEVNLNSNLSNCGFCGNVCASGANASATCTSGACGFICNAGFGNCNGLSGDGCEVNLTSNVNNCGNCNTVCPAVSNGVPTCVSSICGFVCNAGFGNCNNLPGDGCEVNLSNSVNNCGNCGIVCPAVANGSPTCVSSTCGLVCNSGFANCDNVNANGCEVNLNTNTNNCGFCGHVCPGGQSCISGACL